MIEQLPITKPARSSYNPVTGNVSITDTLISRYQNVSPSSSNSTEKTNHDEANKQGGVYNYMKSMFSNSAYLLGHNKYPTPSDFTERERIERLLTAKRTSTSYQSWLETCEELDSLQKFNKWKADDESTLYDFKLIQRNLMDLKEARLSGDTRKLLYLIRTTWSRNIGNMGDVNLYRHTHTGTKSLINTYIEECQLALDMLTESHTDGLDDSYILGMLVQTRKNIGRTALVLSGGGCFGLFHIGVLAALVEESLLPRIISGSSAGAIVASVLCVHNTDEISDILTTIVEKQFNIFDTPDQKETWITGLTRFLKYGTWYDNKHLQMTMMGFLGDLTFREAFNRTGRILNITVSPASEHEQARLLNYLTAPSVLIWSAVCASCSLPGVFPSTAIYEKNLQTGERQEWHHTSVKFLDGSVDNDLPITRLSEMFNVDHIIACQVNPHVVPFLKLSVSCVGGEIETEYSAKFKTKLGQFYQLMASEVSHYLQMSEEIGVARNISSKLRAIISQQYSGDITILPDLDEIVRLDKLLSNPTPEYLLQSTIKGARATWPKIAIIRNHCGLEFALDEAIKKLRTRNFKNFNINYVIPLVNSPMIDSPALTTEEQSEEEEANVLNSNILLETSNPVSQPAYSTKAKVMDPTTPMTAPPPGTRGFPRHRSESLNLAKLRTSRQNATLSNSPSQILLANQHRTSLDHINTVDYLNTSPQSAPPANPRILRNKSEIYFPNRASSPHQQSTYHLTSPTRYPIARKRSTTTATIKNSTSYTNFKRVINGQSSGSSSRKNSMDLNMLRKKESLDRMREEIRARDMDNYPNGIEKSKKSYSNIDHEDGLFNTSNSAISDHGLEEDEEFGSEDTMAYDEDDQDYDHQELGGKK
ncbi:hypothetical protein WICPIJ_001905 [Wickerhamomyces pijperi]|uniref:Patatin-like phospholipase domain-containing protein n=1 Tax=Wickerhamomyces pijperi TaxID=599730 RepID=A0A9P8TQC8_WICPI|nr:hypothetical protein WICPIJ_001905 [Wickerhamomyces pijperi]